MTKVVINTCYGGFSLSQKAVKRYLELNNLGMYCYKGFPTKGYTKIKSEDFGKSLLVYYVTKDLGEFTENIEGHYYFSDREIERDDKVLIRVVEEMGEEANGSYALLKIVDIPDDVEWEIEDYDGVEWVSEVHRRWH